MIEERTVLNERQIIESRRHWFTKEVSLNTQDNVHVICLVEADEILIESPTNAFEAFEIHYAETFIVPAIIGAYTMKPTGKSIGQKCGMMLGYVRNNA